MTKKEDDDVFNRFGDDDPTEGPSSNRPGGSSDVEQPCVSLLGKHGSRSSGKGNRSFCSVNLGSSSDEKKPPKNSSSGRLFSSSHATGRRVSTTSSASNAPQLELCISKGNLTSFSTGENAYGSPRNTSFVLTASSCSGSSIGSGSVAVKEAGELITDYGHLDPTKTSTRVLSPVMSKKPGSPGIKIPIKLSWRGRKLPSIKEWFNLDDCCNKMRMLCQTSLSSKDYYINMSEPPFFHLFASGLKKIDEDPLFEPFKVLLREFWDMVTNPNKSVSRRLCREFIRDLSDTDVFQFLFQVVRRRDYRLSSIRQFRVALEEIWFGRGDLDVKNCSFKHYFAGDLREDGSFSGLHSINQIMEQCLLGNLVAKYRNGKNKICTFSFGLCGKEVKESSCFEGLSPTLELGILSAVVLMGKPYENIVGRGQSVMWYGKEYNGSHGLYPIIAHRSRTP